MQINIKSLTLENFKGVKSYTAELNKPVVNILGANASGKTTLFDSLTWLLFDKDSTYSNKFSIRPLDVFGQPVHHVEIKVEGVFEIDGQEVTITKIQKENWVKHRGNENATFEGNVNSYMVDGIGRSEKDFKGFIGTLIEEDLFKILTNPLYFTGLNWKDQRKELIKLAAEFTDLEFAESDQTYADLIPYFSSITNPSTDDLRKTFATAINNYKKKQKEIPVRIDELEKQKVDYDAGELELQKKSIQEEIGKLDEKSQLAIFDTSESKMQLYEVERQMKEFEIKKLHEMSAERDALLEEQTKIKTDIATVQAKLKSAEIEYESNERLLNSEELKKPVLNQRWKENKDSVFDDSKWIFDDSTTVCSLCGQKLPEERIKALKGEFETKKANAKKLFEQKKEQEKLEINKEVTQVKDSIEEYSKAMENEFFKDLLVSQYFLVPLQKKLSEIELKLQRTQQPIFNGAHYPEYLEMDKKHADIIEQIDLINRSNANTESLKQGYKSQKQALAEELSVVEKKLLQVEYNVALDERISDLNEELRNVSQQIADQERLIYILEEFIKAKMERIADSVNSKFELVKFKLFNVQINGAISETCECTYDGVPFSSLNSARKIQCGLDIINTLCNVYDKYCPIFIDNRESCTDIPDMKSQVINLYVSRKHPTLTIM